MFVYKLRYIANVIIKIVIRTKSKMTEKPKTSIEDLFRNPKNGKYLKVVARELDNLSRVD